MRFSLFSYFSATQYEQRYKWRIKIVEQKDKFKPDHIKLNEFRFNTGKMEIKNNDIFIYLGGLEIEMQFHL